METVASCLFGICLIDDGLWISIHIHEHEW
jgi:hypothetical protein